MRNRCPAAVRFNRAPLLPKRTKYDHTEAKKVGEYDTQGSRVITDLSTNLACGCLTSQIGRDVVLSTKYGRTRKSPQLCPAKGLGRLWGRWVAATTWREGLVTEGGRGARTKALVTNAKKVTVSVLYWYEKLSSPHGRNFYN